MFKKIFILSIFSLVGVFANTNNERIRPPHIEEELKKFQNENESKDLLRNFGYFKLNGLYGFWPQVGAGYRTQNGHDFSASFGFPICNLSYIKLFYSKPKNNSSIYKGVGPNVDVGVFSLFGSWAAIPFPSIKFVLGKQYFEKRKFIQFEFSFPYTFFSIMDKRFNANSLIPLVTLSIGF